MIDWITCCLLSADSLNVFIGGSQPGAHLDTSRFISCKMYCSRRNRNPSYKNAATKIPTQDITKLHTVLVFHSFHKIFSQVVKWNWNKNNKCETVLILATSTWGFNLPTFAWDTLRSSRQALLLDCGPQPFDGVHGGRGDRGLPSQSS